MTPSEYQQLAARTLLPEPGFDVPGDQLMLVWCAIGLAGEAGEIAEAFYAKPTTPADRASRITKECGDYLWYIAGICTTLSLDFASVIESGRPVERFPERDPVEALQMATSRVAEAVKKGVFHRHGAERKAFSNQLGTCFYYLTESARQFAISIPDVMEKNIAKLRERYPNGFTSEDSQKRVDVR